MKVLYYDCFAGISGDMNLGALIDLGVDANHLVNEIMKTGLDSLKINIQKDQRKGIEGTRVEIASHEKHTPKRFLGDIELLIQESSLSGFVKSHSISMFRALATAEAQVHGIPADKVHFHEIGAADSIADIIGAAVCIEVLKPEKIISSPVELGQGMVSCSHGVFPVPAPATALLLQGIPVKTGNCRHEATTPTGAVILKEFVNEFTPPSEFKILSAGYGIGYHNSDIPNVLRVMMIETREPRPAEYVMIECNIDDMNPEYYEYIMDELLTLGADDVFISQLIMKKSRPGMMLSVMCRKELIHKLTEFIFSETTTLGLRSYSIEKNMLERTLVEVNTRFGKITVKKAYSGGKLVNVKPEFAECMRIARENNVPLKEVYSEVLTRFNDTTHHG